MFDVSIITVSHNQAHFLESCLDSIYASSPQLTIETWVIDNCCRDNTAEVAARFAGVKVWRNRWPCSFARNNNIGILLSTGRYVLLLNPDTEVRPGALDALVSFMDLHSGVGICGPQLRNPDGTIQLSCRRFPTPGALLARGTLLGRLSLFKHWHWKYLMTEWDHMAPRRVDWVLGACLLARREAVADVGLLDERFRQYYEEIDWCRRMWRRGWEVWYIPSAQVMHHYQRASAARLSGTTVKHIRSILYYFIKYRFRFADPSDEDR